MNLFHRIGEEVLSWFDAVLIGMPGLIGVKMRNLFYRGRFAGCGKKVSFSQGCLIRNFRKIRIGDHVSVGPGAQFYADKSTDGIEIGEHTCFNSNVMINADKSLGIKIGKDVLVGPNVVFRASGHEFSHRDVPIREQGDRVGSIVVEDDVWIGANAVILRNVRIRKGAIVAAGAVVISDVNEYQIVGGIPAKPIGQRG